MPCLFRELFSEFAIKCNLLSYSQRLHNALQRLLELGVVVLPADEIRDESLTQTGAKTPSVSIEKKSIKV